MTAGAGPHRFDRIAAARDYPGPPVPANHVEPVPRRVRGYLGGEVVLDTTRARYVWEWPFYPQHYVPLADVDARLLVDEAATRATERGTARVHGLRAGGGLERPASVLVFGDDAIDGVAGTVRVDFAALDAWFEEDEPIFVHPRNPYVRVDAVRSHRHVQVSVAGVPLADSSSPVLVFETGLPTRYYLDRTDVAFEHLVPSDTVTACPYKGRTTGYWSVRVGGAVADGHRDLAWSYDFPTRELAPVAGLVCFYNEKVDIVLDGQSMPRPATHFS